MIKCCEGFLLRKEFAVQAVIGLNLEKIPLRAKGCYAKPWIARKTVYPREFET